MTSQSSRLPCSRAKRPIGVDDRVSFDIFDHFQRLTRLEFLALHDAPVHLEHVDADGGRRQPQDDHTPTGLRGGQPKK